jgi:hypothetical protein
MRGRTPRKIAPAAPMSALALTMSVSPPRGRRQRRVPSGRRRLPTTLGFLAGLLPLAAAAQTTEPLLPLPVVPSGPQAPAAPGQLVSPSETVASRPRPEFDPIGMRLGDFFWFPHGEVDELFNSNIFATQSPTSDWITLLQPGFDLLSSLPRNAINLHAGAGAQFYASNSSQNTATGFASADGRLDVDANSNFYGNATVAHLYTPRTSPNSPGNAAEPVTSNQYTANAGYAQTGLRLGYEADLAVQDTQYNAVPLIGGGILPQSASDVITPQAALRLSYELIPDYLGYVRVSGTVYDYTHTPPGGTNFDSNVYRVDAGLQILPRHLIFGEVYFGYLTQVFHSSSLSSTSAPDFGGRLVWNVTGLTTVNLNAIRAFQTINPTSSAGTGYLATVASASVDHELRRDILLNATASYENDGYQGLSRTDDIFTAGAGVRYLVNRNLYLGGSYSYQQRTSSGAAATTPYSQSIVMLRLGTQF